MNPIPTSTPKILCAWEHAEQTDTDRTERAYEPTQKRMRANTYILYMETYKYIHSKGPAPATCNFLPRRSKATTLSMPHDLARRPREVLRQSRPKHAHRLTGGILLWVSQIDTPFRKDLADMLHRRFASRAEYKATFNRWSPPPI